MSNWAILTLCFAAFWLGGVLGYLTAVLMEVAARAEKDSGGFY
jgi:hypothetical protein